MRCGYAGYQAGGTGAEETRELPIIQNVKLQSKKDKKGNYLLAPNPGPQSLNKERDPILQ